MPDELNAPRSPEQRKRDALEILETEGADVWVASASSIGGGAHLVPLSFSWDGEHVVLATEVPALTTGNIVGGGRARLGFGKTRDVVMIDAVLVESIPVGEAPPEVGDHYAGQADWDPRTGGGEFVFLILRPERVQAWREVNELAGRTLMRDGTWLV